MPVVEIICLANSYKYDGRCVAGLRADGKGWVRPTGLGAHGILLPPHYRLPDGTDARILDVLRIGLYEHRPLPYQPENWVVDGQPWELAERPASKRWVPVLKQYLAPGPDLFGDMDRRISVHQFDAAPAPASLALVHPDEFWWHVTAKADGTEHRPRVRFTQHGATYDLPLTDPEWRRKAETLPPGLHPPPAAGLKPNDRLLLTVSLGEPFEEDDCCYKLVAAVIPIPRQWRH